MANGNRLPPILAVWSSLLPLPNTATELGVVVLERNVGVEEGVGVDEGVVWTNIWCKCCYVCVILATRVVAVVVLVVIVVTCVITGVIAGVDVNPISLLNFLST